MTSLNHAWARTIIDELVCSGVTCFCVSPGSRSTPLAVAVARHPEAQAVVHFDERGAAFFALGYARAAGRAAGWITTSGTAVANGLPAVVEAGIEAIPMLLLTADRPPELRETGANQTIDQVGIFGRHVRWQFDLPAASELVDEGALRTTANQAAYRARRGPVHLNCMFRKPLQPTADPPGAQPDLEKAHTIYADSEITVSSGAVAELAKRLSAAQHGLIIAGRLPLTLPKEAAAQLAERLQWPLLADVNSGLRFGPGPGTRIAHYDLLLGTKQFCEVSHPDAVLYLGRPAVSNRLRQFLSEAHPSLFALAADAPGRLDPTHQVTHRYETSIAPFCEALAAALPDAKGGEWLAKWQDADASAAQRLDTFFDDDDRAGEPEIARIISKRAPDDSGLFLASSMPVRDVDRFAAGGGPRLTAAANRGASGIDGTVASAAGLAHGLGRKVTLLIGDLALLHDLNSLALLRHTKAPVIVVVINNDGGGIFSFLPIAEFPDVFENYFGTPHGLAFEAAADLFSLQYRLTEGKKHFEKTYAAACASQAPAIIEVQTNREENRLLHDKIDRIVDDAVING